MADAKADTEAEAVRAWYTSLLDQVVKEMIRVKAVEGAAVQASPVWMLPNRMLMAKVWAVTKESDFVWTLSIDKLIADFVAGSLAATPREAAKHFALKWQMDADRLTNFGQSEASGKKDEQRMQEFSAKLIEHAELLYDLTSRDEAWEEPELE